MKVLGKNERVARANALEQASAAAPQELVGSAGMHYFYALTDVNRSGEESILSTMGAITCTIVALTLADGRAALGHFDGSLRSVRGDTIFADAVRSMLGVFGDGAEIEDLVLSATYLADDQDKDYHQDPAYASIRSAIADAVEVEPRWVHLVEGRAPYEWYDRAVLLPKSKTLLLFGSEESERFLEGRGDGLEVHPYS